MCEFVPEFEKDLVTQIWFSGLDDDNISVKESMEAIYTQLGINME